MHVYEPGYPVRTQGSFPARSATLADYLRVKQRLGLARTVVVQAGAYGTDNRCALDAMARLGRDARGVAIVDPGAPEAEIERLSKLGMRGIRYHMVRSPTLSWESLPEMAARVAAFGWHAQVQCEPHEIAEREKMLAGLPCDLVIDHVARMHPPLAHGDAGWRVLRALVDRGRCWVKLSAPYHGSRSGPPDYADVGALAKELVRAAPERMLWATNWPHPSVAENPPDDAGLLDLLAEWAPDEAATHKILVFNPARLYGFPV